MVHPQAEALLPSAMLLSRLSAAALGLLEPQPDAGAPASGEGAAGPTDDKGSESDLRAIDAAVTREVAAVQAQSLLDSLVPAVAALLHTCAGSGGALLPPSPTCATPEASRSGGGGAVGQLGLEPRALDEQSDPPPIGSSRPRLPNQQDSP